MMADSAGPFRFFVEGADDFHAILNLLARHELSRETLPQKFPPFRDPKIEHGQGKDAVLRAIETAVKVNSNESVGFVLDADDDISARWESVAQRLQNVGVDIGAGLDPAGFLGESSEYGTRVGVWLMPDNRQAGRLEDFLEGLVDQTNPLLPHAQEATNGAKALGAAFSDTKASKAVLHAWLAWQQEPGRPYGIAIKSGYLRHDSAAAERFVAWFRRLFALEEPTT
ncbi:DUF3226 domain-containing protein [Candidatus Palauibacter sp.]|uniref:DUF3226 domain-containing protein n=1 Tax=Candidatus Palauibacter sp. TaxID=3101350 RepID=UPI003B025FB1